MLLLEVGLSISDAGPAKKVDFLYGDVNGKDLSVTFDDLEDYAILDKWSAQDWSKLLDKWIFLLQISESS